MDAGLPPLIGDVMESGCSPEMSDSVRNDEDYLAWELFGNRAVRQGNWKLRWQWKPYGKGDWELFDLASDPGERKDLASERPEQAAALLESWDDYVRANNVILPSRSPSMRAWKTRCRSASPNDPGYPPLIYKRQFVPPS